MADGYRKESLPKKSVAMKILSAYEGGVTSIAEGVEYTAFGRDQEVLRFNQTLEMTKNSSGRMEAYIGPYGVGKSFIMALFQNLAIKKGFVVMTADITRHCWFAGTNYDKQGLNLYRQLIRQTAIKGKTSGAFDTILEKWYYDILEECNNNEYLVSSQFNKLTRDCKDLPMYDDIRGVILNRFSEIRSDSDHSNAMEYFLANITRKTDANALGARDYIRESGWFDILNTWSHLFVKAGYKGLIVMFDQVDYLTNLPKTNRQQNYEFLLSMWNAVNEGRTEYLSVCLFAAEKLVDDERRGTQMYQALDDRLAGSTRLEILPDRELLGLLNRLKDIHELAHGWESGITEEEIRLFVNDALKVSSSHNCVRPISKSWVKYLNDKQLNNASSRDVYLDNITEEARRENEAELRRQEEDAKMAKVPLSQDTSDSQPPSQNLVFPDD